MEFKQWLEDKKTDIARMQPETVITVFHGTDFKNAYKFCTNGIDARHYKHHRIYSNHISGGKQIKFGIFVTPDLNVAFKFGTYVVKFKTLAKNLIHMFPAEMAKNQKYYTNRYPDSFRPIVSNELLTNSVETQALFIGLISPRAIEKVYKWENGKGTIAMTTEEFITSANKTDHKLSYNQSYFEPQEYKMSLSDFVKRIAKQENSTEEEILDILKRVYARHGYLTGIGNIPYSLLRRIERQLQRIM